MEKATVSKSLFTFNEIIKDSDNIYRKFAKSFGLSESAFWVIYSLRVEKPPITQKDLANLIYSPKQTINSTLKNLEADGYIVMTSDKDKRKKQISLTEKGKELVEKTADIMIDIEKTAINTLSPEEKEMFFTLFKKYNNELRKNLEKLENNK